MLHVDPFPHFSDQGWYFDVAENLAEGEGFVAHHHNTITEPPDVPQVTAYRPPAYPFALAALWKIVGVGETSARLFNAVLGALTILFVYALGREVFDRRAGLLSAGLYAVLPSAIVWLPLTLSEPLFTLVFVAALWLLFDSSSQTSAHRPAVALLFGLLAGLATLTRGQGLVLLPLALLLWLARDGPRGGLKQIGLALLTATLVITPWTIRNWVAMDSPIFVASNSGVNLRIGHASDANGTFRWMNDPIDGVQALQAADRPDWEVRAYQVYPRRALSYALTHPGRELVLAAKKIYYTYQSESWMVHALTWAAEPLRPRTLERSLRPLIDVSWYVVLFAAVASTPVWLGRKPQRYLPAAVVVLWSLFHIVFFGLARFHLPLLPLFVVCAVGGTRTYLAAARTRFRRS